MTDFQTILQELLSCKGFKPVADNIHMWVNLEPNYDNRYRVVIGVGPTTSELSAVVLSNGMDSANKCTFEEVEKYYEQAENMKYIGYIANGNELIYCSDAPGDVDVKMHQSRLNCPSGTPKVVPYVGYNGTTGKQYGFGIRKDRQWIHPQGQVQLLTQRDYWNNLPPATRGYWTRTAKAHRDLGTLVCTHRPNSQEYKGTIPVRRCAVAGKYGKKVDIKFMDVDRLVDAGTYTLVEVPM